MGRAKDANASRARFGTEHVAVRRDPDRARTTQAFGKRFDLEAGWDAQRGPGWPCDDAGRVRDRPRGSRLWQVLRPDQANGTGQVSLPVAERPSTLQHAGIGTSR